MIQENLVILYALVFFLVIAVLVYFWVKNDYVKQKSLWWIYIILFCILLFLYKYSLILALIVLFVLSCLDFFKTLLKTKFSSIKKALFIFLFLAVLSGFIYFIFHFPKYFFYLFVVVSFSDIIAYFVGKNLTWKKWFVNLSPNKALSGVLAQIGFIFLALMIYFYFQKMFDVKYVFLAIFVAVLAPLGDLAESYFKRKAEIKDMWDYIPWHWWVLDRIDSSLLSVGIIGLVVIFIQCCF